MLLAEAWTRYRRSWQTLMAANLFTNLITSALLLWPAGGMLAQLAANPGALPAVHELQPLSWLMLAWPIGLILGSAFVQGGLYGTVASVWRDPETRWTAVWGQGWRNWWRMFKVSLGLGFGLLLPVAMLLALVFLLVAFIGSLLSLPGFISVAVFILLALFGGLPAVAATYYGAYAAVADGAGGSHAVGEGWRCMTTGYADCLVTALTVSVVGAALAVITLPIGVVLMAAHIPPLVSQLVSLILQSLITPTFLTLYIAGRYETNQRR